MILSLCTGCIKEAFPQGGTLTSDQVAASENALPAKAAQECVIKKNTTIQMFVGCGWTLPCIPHTCMSSGSVDDAYPGGWL